MKLPRKSKAMESQSVAKPRGRPRKYQRKEDKTITGDQKSVSDEKKSLPIVLIGRHILKEFPKGPVLLGKVVSYASGLYRVTYEDDSYDDLNSSKIRRLLLDDSYFDDDLTRRKIKLDEWILAKVAIVSEKNSSQLNDDLLIVNEEERDVMDVDSFSDSKDSCSNAESMLPLPLQLPPSSGTIGLPEKCVSHFFSVYTFLRSFSTRLFLSPFTLDDFVGALNCRVSNTLLDAIHVSLLRALKRHLENLSAAGSKTASKCIRCTEWSLLDTLTWPVYVLQYIAVNGYTLGPEWKGFYGEVFYGEYYLLPADRKLTILQILCDDVLESEELKAEMNMREKSEVGMNYDAEHILPSESGPRRVHPRYAKTAGSKDDKTMNFDSELNAVNVPDNSEDAIDNNGDECCLCGMDGTLLCCDGCPATYHSRCIGVRMHMQEGEWYCRECLINRTGPTISRGTLKGAEIFGNDLYGQLFIGTCDHLLVLNLNRGECCLKYYNQNDIPGVIRLLYASMQHRPLYVGICTAILQYWSIAESFLDHCVPNGTLVKSENTKIDYDLSAALLPTVVEDELGAVSLGKAECSLTSMSGICSDDRVPSLDSLLVTSSPSREISGNGKANVNMKLHKETMMDSVVSTVNLQSNISCPNPGNKSTAADPVKHSLVSSQFINYGHASDMRLPMNLSLQTQGDKTGFGKCKGNITNDFVYMGCTFKHQSYINSYMHGDFAASAAANLAILSSEDSRSEGLVLDNWRKATSGYIYLMAKAFSQTVSRFSWPCSDNKHVEVLRERCGWCLGCKAPVSSKKGCMLNHAVVSAKNTMKIFPGLATVRSGEGIIASIASYVIFMEESLRGLIDGPFVIDDYRKLWRKQVEKATSFSDIKPLLLKLEENIRIIAFSGDWVKLMDDWFVQSLTILSATSTLGTTQKRAPFGSSRKQLPIKVTAKTRHENFAWWNGDKFSKSIFQRAILPKSTVRKAARQGGLKKILGIFYPDGSEIPKRSRQLVWRAAVQMSRNASQLALQVRYLDFHIRWIDLIRLEHSFQDVKGQDIEASAFRNANICDKKLAEGNFFYGIAFGSQKHLPRVMKNVEIEQGPEGKKYWFLETRIPLYLVKEYEVSNEKAPSQNEISYVATQLHRKQLKTICKDIFSYLTCKRDKTNVLSCSVCQLDVLFRNALKCSECQGYFHAGCSSSSIDSVLCKQCYYTKLLARKETSNKSLTTPLLLKGQEHSSLTSLEGPRPKCDDQVPKSAREKGRRPDRKQDASVFPPEAKSHRKNSTWGVIWKKKNIEDTGIDFRIKNILLKRHSSLPQLEPVCRLCLKPYRSDLMYICCETCKNWYHTEAVELDESKIINVLGFKCCKCRKIKSPVCPYSDLTCKEQHATKSHSRSFKKEHSGRTYSDSETLTDKRASAAEDVSRQENVTPIFPAEDVSRQENNHPLFSLSNVEFITESKLDASVECNAVVSGTALQNSPANTHVKPDGDNNGSFGGEVKHDEFLTGDELDNLPEIDSALLAECNLLKNSDIVDNNEYMDYDPNTNFSELDCQFEEADLFGDLSEYGKDSCTFGFPEECTTGSLTQNWGPVSSQGTVNNCSQCSKGEPVPDLCCQICSMWIHNQCSPWIESPSRLIGGWKCGNCREWR